MAAGRAHEGLDPEGPRRSDPAQGSLAYRWEKLVPDAPAGNHSHEELDSQVVNELGALPSARIASANDQITSERVAARSRHLMAGRIRQQIGVIDELIGVLEERNLEGERRVDRALRSRLRYVESEVGLPVPRRVLRARNTARMHGALLDWMETVVNQILPKRDGLPDGELEPELGRDLD